MQENTGFSIVKIGKQGERNQQNTYVFKEECVLEEHTESYLLYFQGKRMIQLLFQRKKKLNFFPSIPTAIKLRLGAYKENSIPAVLSSPTYNTFYYYYYFFLF